MRLILPVILVLVAGCQPQPQPEPELQRPSGAWSSMDWMTQVRAYPALDIPDTGFAEAVAAKRAASKSADWIIDPWEPIGPHNVAGRMLAVSFNPQNAETLLAGSASGGLWRSWTGGEGVEAWHRVDTGFPVLSASALAYAPADSMTIYLGTGEVYNYGDRDGRGVTHRPSRGSYGIGILVSRDGGDTWSKSLDWAAAQGRGVQMIVVNPIRKETVWAATTEGLLVSYDSGESWSVSNPVVMGTDIAVHASDTTRVFAAHGNLGSAGHGLYRSLDGGTSWDKMAAGLPSSYRGKALLDIAPSEPGVIYSTIGNGFSSGDGNWLVRSSDGGDSWEVRHSETNFVGSQGWYSHDVSVDPAEPNSIVVLGFLIYRSEDAGGVLLPATEWNSWTVAAPQIGQHDGPPVYTHPDHHAVVRHPENSSYMLFATDGGIYRTTDGAKSFRALNGGLQTVQFYPGMSNSARDSEIAMAGTQDNTTLLYRGTKRWRILSGGDGAWTAIDPNNPSRFYWSSQYLAMRASVDGGVSSVSIRPPGSNRFTGFVAPFVLSPANPDRIYAGRDLVYVSQNRGNVWGTANRGQPLTGEPLVSLAASGSDADVAYAVTAPGSFDRGRVFVTLNGGTAWTDITGPLPDRYIVDVALDPTDDSRVFVAVAGFENDHVYRSTDQGATWQAVGSGLPDLPTWSVVVDPHFPETVFAGNDVGVYISTNGGSAWEPFDAGLPEAIIAMDLSVSVVERKLRVATHGNGMWQRALDGEVAPPETPIAQDFAILTVFPNPSSGLTQATYVLDEAGPAHLGVYNAGGELVMLLYDGHQSTGRATHSFTTSGLPAGAYLVRLQSDGLSATTPLAVVR